MFPLFSLYRIDLFWGFCELAAAGMPTPHEALRKTWPFGVLGCCGACIPAFRECGDTARLVFLLSDPYFPNGLDEGEGHDTDVVKACLGHESFRMAHMGICMRSCVHAFAQALGCGAVREP